MHRYKTGYRRNAWNYKFIIFITLVALILLVFSIVNYNYMTTQYQRLNEDHKTLIFVQVLFRHGQRTPMGKSYPTDPYRNVTYEPYGPARLTWEGEKMAYSLGSFLRKHYYGFLGSYHRDILYAQSSPRTRSLESLLMVLAGLYPPSKSQQIVNTLNWRPIPYYYNAGNSDKIFLYFINCGKYVRQYNELDKNVTSYIELENVTELLYYLDIHAGVNITKVSHIFQLGTMLLTQRSLGLHLPIWADKFLSQWFDSAVKLHYTLQTRTDTLKTLSGGFILKEIIDAISKKIAKHPAFVKRKIHLYSGHDYTITNMLSTLGFNVTSTPPYMSFVSFELHKINETLGIKLLYHDYSTKIPKVLTFPGCDDVCRLDIFLERYGKYLATSEMCN